jgi:hypothetical protein
LFFFLEALIENIVLAVLIIDGSVIIIVGVEICGCEPAAV